MDQPNHLEEPYKESSKQYLSYFKDKFNDNWQSLLPMIHDISIAICVSNDNGIIEDVNDAYCALYQYSRNELVGQHFTKVVPDALKTKLMGLYEDFMTKEQELANELNVQRKDGSLLPVYTNASYVVKDGAPKKVTFVLDISNTKKTESELKETIGKLNTLVTSQEQAMELLLHDLRGPVSNILALTDFLSDESFKPEKKAEIVLRLQQSAQRAFDLTNRLYGIIQIESDKYVPAFGIIDLYKMVADIWDDLAILIKVKKLTLEQKKLSAMAQGLMLNSDKFLLNIIFYNLLKNAVEASPKEKKIGIEYIQEEEQLLVAIHNESEIPEEIQQNFFQKYITSGKAKGTGLGTYMVKKAAALLQGDVSFTSTAQEGTFIYLKFPTTIIHQE